MERKYNKQPKLHIRKGDDVKVIAGNDKGKTGKVVEVIAEKSRVVVEGVRMITKHQKPSAGKPEGGIKKMEESPMKELLLKIERTKASIRAKVEHPFHVIKNLFGYRKVRYKGLAKNQAQLFSLFGLANLVLATRCEGRVDGASAP